MEAKTNKVKIKLKTKSESESWGKQIKVNWSNKKLSNGTMLSSDKTLSDDKSYLVIKVS